MIKVNIKDNYGGQSITREHGNRLRSFLETNWDKTDSFELDFGQLKIASVSFFDEAIGKLAPHIEKEQLKMKLNIINIDDFDKKLLNQVVRERYDRLKN